MTTIECPQLSLVEALHDGRLGPQEHASLARHVATCTECGAMARDLDLIRATLHEPIEPATPLEHQRARHAIQRRAAQAPGSVAPRPRVIFAFAAAAMALTTVAGWAGGRLTAPQRAQIAVQQPELQAHFVTTVGPSGGARFERSRGGGTDAVTLTSGALDVSVRALPVRERFILRTSDAEIAASGTTFRVEADQGHIRGITVATGSVEVRYAGFLAVIPAGGSWRASEPVAAALPSAPEPKAAPAPSVEPPPVKVATAAAPSPKWSGSRAVPPPVMAQNAPPPEPAPAPPPEPAPPLASRDFAAAMQALGRGDYDDGAARLQEFAAAHPSDARADEADYVRALALQRAGHTAEAKASARRYLAIRPSGAHRAEAAKIAGQ